jgi:hypothetical protein
LDRITFDGAANVSEAGVLADCGGYSSTRREIAVRLTPLPGITAAQYAHFRPAADGDDDVANPNAVHDGFWLCRLHFGQPLDPLINASLDQTRSKILVVCRRGLKRIERSSVHHPSWQGF